MTNAIQILTLFLISFIDCGCTLSPSAKKKRRQRQNQSQEQVALARERDRISKMNQHHAKTHEQAALAREEDKLRKLQSRSENQDCDMKNVINQSMKESVKYLHQTKAPENPLKHRAIVCIICDHFIIGIEAIHKLTMKEG